MIPIIVVSVIIILNSYNDLLCNKNESYRNFKIADHARNTLKDGSNMFDSGNRPWKDAEKSLNNFMFRNSFFSVFDYRLLMTTHFLGNKEIFSSENLPKVSDLIKYDVHDYSLSRVNFKIKDYVSDFKFWCLLFILLFF